MAIKTICGLVGKGKTYLMTKIVMDYQRKRKDWTVFANIPIAYSDPDNKVKKLTKEMLENQAEFPERSLLVIDEANSWFNSRNYKNLDQNVQDLFHWHRQLKIDFLLITQIPMRLDIVIRDLCEDWIWSRAYKIPSRKFHDGRAILFCYDHYNLHEDFFIKDKKTHTTRMIPKQEVFHFYQTYNPEFRAKMKPVQFDDWEGKPREYKSIIERVLQSVKSRFKRKKGKNKRKRIKRFKKSTGYPNSSHRLQFIYTNEKTNQRLGRKN